VITASRFRARLLYWHNPTRSTKSTTMRMVPMSASNFLRCGHYLQTVISAQNPRLALKSVERLIMLTLRRILGASTDMLELMARLGPGRCPSCKQAQRSAWASSSMHTCQFSRLQSGTRKKAAENQITAVTSAITQVMRPNSYHKPVMRMATVVRM